MTNPARTSADESQGTDVASGQLDPTLARPSGVAPSANPFDPKFGPPANPDEVGTLGRYRVLKKLGQGGMGAVYLGFDVTLGRRVALKVMLPQHAADPESRERFLREARAAAMVKSDHAVTIFDVGDQNGIAFIAMEYLLGAPLDQYLRTYGELPLAQVYRVGRETALGLAAAHDLGLIHRDIKPGNIWLEAPKGRVKLLDFGLARVANDDTHLTGDGMVVGTPSFMSPEQARGHKLDGRSDLFSLGIMLYRLATGRMPFDGPTTMAVLTALAVDEPPPVRKLKPDLPRPLATVIHKLLAKRPDGRYATAWDVAEALAEAERIPAEEGESSVVDDSVPMAIPVQSGNVWESLEGSGSLPRALSAGTAIVTPPAAAAVRNRPREKDSRLIPALVGVAILATLVAVIAVAAAMIRPTKGTLVIETEDPDAELLIKRGDEVIREKTRDREIRLEPGVYSALLVGGRPGDQLTPDTFPISGKQTTRVRITVGRDKVETFTAKLPSFAATADHRAADYAFMVGGSVRINGGTENHTSFRGMPKEFAVTAMNLSGRPGVKDAELFRVRDCNTITELRLSRTAITDAGLENFKGCSNLTVLDLDETRVGDAGLAHFKRCKSLRVLRLHGTAVTDAGLKNFDGISTVTELRLSETAVGNTGLGYFQNCKQLTRLIVYGTEIGNLGLKNFDGATELIELDLGGTHANNVGLMYFKNCKKLQLLSLPYAATAAGAAYFQDCGQLHTLCASRTSITDDGLAHFKDCRELEALRLEAAGAVTDTGLAHFQDCPKLLEVDVRATKVTEAGVKAFNTARPNCKITWKGGTLGPKK